jgi:uncharacterized protein YecT (DUF1311 family)
MGDVCSRRRVPSAGLALAAVSAAMIGSLAACASDASTPATTRTVTSGTAAASAAATAPPSAASAFVPITEPFDPGHAARAESSPASCASQHTTLAIEQCYEAKAETADAAIDAVRQAGFASSSATQQAAINADDSGWLAARETVCGKAFQTGGTIDGINISACLLDESTARLDAVKGVSPAEAVRKSTDSTSLSDVSWYTTPKGSRIGMIDTQGDATGGVIIQWVIIAGADGFRVNPAQFAYSDGSFTDAGKVQPPDPRGHQVAPGSVYEFSIDYARLSADPNSGKAGGWVYAPGAPAAVWR